ncbi:hypothetical protein GCM10007377_10900 [Galliscardovia ingluviei]|uniref:Uncharacterized protein n=1 Tax=Galliscardovia ingluviei TaxID=1769422 RepID=A0A8J3EZH2_9BIFI|nr:hypothetical protein GCM10007377_10900 [Galliscardovia ingluviei]
MYGLFMCLATKLLITAYWSFGDLMLAKSVPSRKIVNLALVRLVETCDVLRVACFRPVAGLSNVPRAVQLFVRTGS